MESAWKKTIKNELYINKMSEDIDDPDLYILNVELNRRVSELQELYLNWSIIKTALVESLEHTFTDKEIEKLAKFYKSELGQKLVKYEPEMIAVFSSKVGDTIRTFSKEHLKALDDYSKALDRLVEESE
ncbi:MAG: DUF2059 domain-containing protein [Agarilytica sp.]